MGAMKVIHRGAQNHRVDPTKVAQLIATLYPDTAHRLTL
jgi:hypothetical protein